MPWTPQRVLQRYAPQPDRDAPDALKPMNLGGQLTTTTSDGGGGITNTLPGLTDFSGGTTTGTTGVSAGSGGQQQNPATPYHPNAAVNPNIPTPIVGKGNGRNPAPPQVVQPGSQASPGNFSGGGLGANSLEMNPHYQAGLAALDENLRQELTSLGIEEQDLEATIQLLKARLGFDHKETLRRTDESMNDRGLYDSGIRQRDRGYVDYDFNNKYQDLAMDRGRSLRDIYGRRSAAEMRKRMGATDLGLSIADLMSQDPGIDVPGDPYQAPQAQGQQRRRAPSRQGSRPRQRSGRGRRR